MKPKCIVLSLIFLFLTSSIYLSAQDETVEKSNFSAGILAGYSSGFGVQGHITASDFALEFPFKIRIGAGYRMFDPGNALDARRIFINNNTNGVPEKNGRTFDYKLDFLLPKTIFSVENSYLKIGPRYTNFKGNFKYVGGNEDFDVKSNQWGIGIGIENHFRMTQKLDLVLAYGVDYYISSKLTGHDTSYTPDNENINARQDNENDNEYFTFNDVDDAINQPKFVIQAMIGICFGL